MPAVLSAPQIAAFHGDGFVHARRLFDARAAEVLRRATGQCPAVARTAAADPS